MEEKNPLSEQCEKRSSSILQHISRRIHLFQKTMHSVLYKAVGVLILPFYLVISVQLIDAAMRG